MHTTFDEQTLDSEIIQELCLSNKSIFAYGLSTLKVDVWQIRKISDGDKRERSEPFLSHLMLPYLAQGTVQATSMLVLSKLP